MKNVSIRYLTKEGFRNVWVNRMMSVASVCVLLACLVMIGIAFLTFVNVQALLDKVDEQNVIMVFVERDLPDYELDRIESELRSISNVSDDIIFRSAEENSRDFYDTLENELLIRYMEEGHAIPASFEVHLRDMALFDNTLSRVKNITNIQYVRESSQLAKFLVSLRKAVSYISVGAIVMLLLVSIFIISNTVRITMHSRRLEIGIMKNVGATNSFIKWPFMVEGMVLGGFSGLLSLGAVFGIYTLILKSLESALELNVNINPVPFAAYVLWLLIGFEVIGITTGGFGSLISIKKYLKEKDYDEILEED